MKTNVFKWVAILLFAFVSVGFSECGKDEWEEFTPDTPGEITAANLYGTWEYSEGDDRIVVTIKSGGTYTATEYEDGNSYGGSGKWEFVDGYLSIELPDGWDKYKVVSVSSNELVLRNFPNQGDCVWKRK